MASDEGIHWGCVPDRCTGVHPPAFAGPDGRRRLPDPAPIDPRFPDDDRCPRVDRSPSYPWSYLKGLNVGIAPAWLYAVGYDPTPEDRAAIAAWNLRGLDD